MRGFPVTDPELDAPDGAVVDGFVRVGDHWRPVDALARTEDEALAAKFKEYLVSDRAKRTFQGYAQDWKTFTKWHTERGGNVEQVAPEDVARYLTYLDAVDHRSRSHIERAYYGIKFVLCRSGKAQWAAVKGSSLVISTILDALARREDSKPKKKRAISVSELARIVEPCGTDLRGARDRAILLLGWYAVLRRSELSALEVRDITFTDEGMRVLVRRSKTDQEAKGLEKPIFFNESARYCAVSSTRTWLERAGIAEGPLFRAIPARGTVVGDRGLSGIAIWEVVRARCKSVGLTTELYGAHSLRAGGITAAAEAGKPIHSIQQLSGHRSIDQLMEYVRPARLFDNEVTKGIGPK